MPEFIIEQKKYPVFELGAKLLSLVAYPGADDAGNRSRLEQSLSASYVHDRIAKDPEFKFSPEVMQRSYFFRESGVIKTDTRSLERILKKRMASARMALAYLKEAQIGKTPNLPPGIARVSLNELSKMVQPDLGWSDPDNVETRAWRETLPVIHLAVAIEFYMAAFGNISWGDLIGDFEVISWVITEAEACEGMIERISKFPIDPTALYRVRFEKD
jgi:hypothetical protein